jgi:bifunctional DNA-binding transcriptional regulator/antitoxin component of YhaV-PrlF toxin-antitoxin module
MKTTITNVDGQAVLIIPENLLAKVGMVVGDPVLISITPAGFGVHRYDPVLARVLEISRDVTDRYHGALKQMDD